MRNPAHTRPYSAGLSMSGSAEGTQREGCGVALQRCWNASAIVLIMLRAYLPLRVIWLCHPLKMRGLPLSQGQNPRLLNTVYRASDS